MAASFSSRVKVLSASIAAFLASADLSISALAFGFASATGFTALIAVSPLPCSVATSALVVAASIASLAACAASSTCLMAASFSSRVRVLSASIAAFLASAALSTSALAFGFASATGVMAAMAVSPLPCSVATSALVVAASIASLAA